MKYEKRYIIIKDEDDSIFGYVKLEKDGKVKIKYDLSVFSFFIDLYVVYDGRIIKQFSNVLQSANFDLNFDNLNLAFVFITDKRIYVAGTVPSEILDKIKNEILQFNNDIIDNIVGRIFTIKNNISFFEKIKNPLEELFNELENHDLKINYKTLCYVEIEENKSISVVGKLYDSNCNLIAIGMGSKFKNNNFVSSSGFIKTKDDNYLIMEFYDSKDGNRILYY